MIGQLDHNSIEKLLKENVIGRIGCSYNGFTYVVPISYAYDGKYVYAYTSEGMKVDLMRKNPDVCFEVDNTANMANWQSVIAWGKYEELVTPEDKLNACKILNERSLPQASSVTTHIGREWPFCSENLFDDEEITGLFFRIKMEKKTGRFESSEQQDQFA